MTWTNVSGPLRDACRGVDGRIPLATSFGRLCTFSAAIPASALVQRKGKKGTWWPANCTWWAADFVVVISLGTSEMTCYVEWTENVSTLIDGRFSPKSEYLFF